MPINDVRTLAEKLRAAEEERQRRQWAALNAAVRKADADPLATAAGLTHEQLNDAAAKFRSPGEANHERRMAVRDRQHQKNMASITGDRDTSLTEDEQRRVRARMANRSRVDELSPLNAALGGTPRKAPAPKLSASGGTSLQDALAARESEFGAFNHEEAKARSAQARRGAEALDPHATRAIARERQKSRRENKSANRANRRAMAVEQSIPTSRQDQLQMLWNAAQADMQNGTRLFEALAGRFSEQDRIEAQKSLAESAAQQKAAAAEQGQANWQKTFDQNQAIAEQDQDNWQSNYDQDERSIEAALSGKQKADEKADLAVRTKELQTRRGEFLRAALVDGIISPEEQQYLSALDSAADDVTLPKFSNQPQREGDQGELRRGEIPHTTPPPSIDDQRESTRTDKVKAAADAAPNSAAAARILFNGNLSPEDIKAELARHGTDTQAEYAKLDSNKQYWQSAWSDWNAGAPMGMQGP